MLEYCMRPSTATESVLQRLVPEVAESLGAASSPGAAMVWATSAGVDDTTLVDE